MTMVAAIQMASGPNLSANLAEAERLVSDSVAKGAKLVVLPENFYLMGHSENDKVELSEEEGEGPIQQFLSGLASRHGIWLAGGTVPLKSSDANKVRASCLLYNDKGEQVARYDKIHLFDVDVPDSVERYVESETIEPGDQVVVVDTPFGKLGLAICYDLRFPELFRTMIDKGMEILVLPSAFTATTGKAHWEPLVRARAIENVCYVISSGQGGYHANGRETHGDSIIVEPWGGVLDRLPRGSGFVNAEIDCERLRTIRNNFPVLNHRRFMCK
ncbi:MAG: carbon-nitrogen hydrolase family protein [Proteobacteria bacterium]|nr:carbon-nitrogen hydrolase family protein [Pseudomonadota bacterium]